MTIDVGAVIGLFALGFMNVGIQIATVRELSRRVRLLEEWKERKQERAELSAVQLTGGHSVV